MHRTRCSHCHRWNPYIFCVLSRYTDARRGKLKKGNLQKLSLHVRWKTFGGHFASWLGHVNSSAPIMRGVDCFIVSKLQCESPSFNDSPPLHCLLNKHSGVETSQWDCRAWPCNCLDHFHDKMAGMASHRRLKNIFGSKSLMKRGFYLKSAWTYIVIQPIHGMWEECQARW